MASIVWLYIFKRKANALTTINESVIVADIEEAITLAQEWLPSVIAAVSVFAPQASVVTPFLPLFAEALNAVKIVAQATGVDTATATTAVINTVIPGAPNSPVLTANPADAPINSQ